MRLAITGSGGFLGQHLRLALRSAGAHTAIPINRSVFENDVLLTDALRSADAVVHLAGVNRADPEVVEFGNISLAERLTRALDSARHYVPILYANSVMSDQDSPYGRGKRLSAQIITAWAEQRRTVSIDMQFQNVFGERALPYYNSVVATFCHELAAGRTPTLTDDRTLQLQHAQDAAQLIIDELEKLELSRVVATFGSHLKVSELLDRLSCMSAQYCAGRIPQLTGTLDTQLFNTYRSHLYPGWYPRSLRANKDHRGTFVEVLQSLAGPSQTSFSTTSPGVTRGNHYHLRKVERFVVVSGRAEIAIRPVLQTSIATFTVDGNDPVFIDMPTLCTHNIKNVGDTELYTIFWTNEIFDPADADTYPEPVFP